MAASRKSRKLEDLDADEFMRTACLDDDSSNDESEGDVNLRNPDSDGDSSEADVAQHKADLAKLKEKDPEFYQYLQENDAELLGFGEDEDDDQSEDNDDENNTITRKKTKTKKDKKVKFESSVGDESDEEMESSDLKTEIVVNSELTAQWSEQLRKDPNLKTVRMVISVFQSAVQQASGVESGAENSYVVKGSSAFNSVMKLCLVDLLPALHKLLRLPPSTSEYKEGERLEPAKSRNWKKYAPYIRHYLIDVIKVVSVVAEKSVVCVLLKHILTLIPFYIVFPRMTRLLLKKVINFWSTGEETVRVLAFLCIVRLGRNLPGEYLEFIMKQMYMSFVKNSKFTSPSTWPHINFMKQSIVELFSLDQGLAYTLGFTYVRQLAIHLRNAITVKKKDAYQAVYNWQYVHSLLLWLRLVYTLHPSDVLQPLIYPLTQTIIGTIKLIPAAKYFPLRFHLIRGLIELSKNTDTHVPVLPLLLEVFDLMDVNKKHASLSLRPMDFSCALKVSKSQLQENGFKDATMNNFQQLLMDYLNSQAHTISFPELVFPLTVQLKNFLKNCKVANYNRQIKQILDKIEETAQTIADRRKNVSFRLDDAQAIERWEHESYEKGTPFGTYYASWMKVKQSVAASAANAKVDSEKTDSKGKASKEDGNKKVAKQKMVESQENIKKTTSTFEGVDEGDIVRDFNFSSDEEEDEGSESEEDSEGDEMDD